MEVDITFFSRNFVLGNKKYIKRLSETHSGPSETSKKGLLTKLVMALQLLPIFTKHHILDVGQGHKSTLFIFDLKLSYLQESVRSSHRRCSVGKGVLQNFAKFTGKHLCQSLFFTEHLWTAASRVCFNLINQTYEYKCLIQSRYAAVETSRFHHQDHLDFVKHLI